MQTLERIRSRIDQAEDLQSVVRTMKGLAAVRVRQFERAVEGLREYARVVEQSMQVLLHHRPEMVRRHATGPDGPILALIVGSDQGLVGQFNRRVLDHALDVLGEARQRAGVLGAGRQVCQSIDASGLRLDESRALPRSVEGIAGTAQRLVLAVERRREASRPSRVAVFHNRPTGTATYEPVVREVLPLSLRWIEDLAGPGWPGRCVPFHRDQWEDLLFTTIQQHIYLVLLRALGESMAAENSSRMAAMQAAESNIDDRLAGLRRQYHRRRQSAITEELLDVMAGYEATGGE
jgi:F-type H+-transporting ATPase subunit gamma